VNRSASTRSSSPTAPRGNFCRRKPARASSAAQGTYEDVHAIGQDDVEEKLPLELERVLDARSVRRVEWPEARLVSFPWQLIEFNGAAIADELAQHDAREQARRAGYWFE